MTSTFSSKRKNEKEQETVQSLPDAGGDTDARGFKTVNDDVQDLIRQGKVEESVTLASAFLADSTFGKPWDRSVLLTSALEAAGRRSEAISMLESIDLRIQGHQLLAEFLVRDGRPQDAVATLPSKAEIDTLPNVHVANFQLRRAKVLMDTGNSEDGRAALDAAIQAADTSQPNVFWLNLANLSIAADRFDTTLEAIGKIATSPHKTPAQIRRAFNIFRTIIDRNHESEALVENLSAFDTYVIENPNDIQFLLMFVRLLPKFSRTDRARELVSNAPLSNLSTDVLNSLIQAQMAVDATAAAAVTARRILATEDLDPDMEVRMSIIVARCLAIEQRYDEALAFLQEIWSRNHNSAYEQTMLMLMRKTGTPKQLSAMVKEIRLSQASSLPSTLAEGLASIAPVKGPVLEEAPLSLVIPWKLSGRPEQDWPDWSSRVQWGKDAGDLLAHWGHYAGLERRQELLDLIDPIDEAPLQEALSLGRGVILFGTHMGPIASVFFALEQMGSQFAFVGAGGLASSTRATEILLSDTGNRGSVGEMIRHLKNNGILAIANDAMSSGDGQSMKLAGFDCKMSRVVPRLSRSLSTPSLWYQAEWADDRIQVKYRKMPQYESGEPISDWEDRWFAACKNLVTTYATTAPENQNRFTLHSKPLIRRRDEWWGG